MKALRNLKRSEGFTLIEIMIVVLIIGILLAIAVPNFMKARETSRAKGCIANMKQIAGAKEQWAMDNNKGQTDTPTFAMIKGPDSYIKSTNTADLVCPAGGTYTIGDMLTDPVCSLGATVTPSHILP